MENGSTWSHIEAVWSPTYCSFICLLAYFSPISAGGCRDSWSRGLWERSVALHNFLLLVIWEATRFRQAASPIIKFLISYASKWIIIHQDVCECMYVMEVCMSVCVCVSLCVYTACNVNTELGDILNIMHLYIYIPLCFVCKRTVYFAITCVILHPKNKHTRAGLHYATPTYKVIWILFKVLFISSQLKSLSTKTTENACVCPLEGYR